MKFWKLASVVTTIGFSTSVNASIVSTDWQTAGDNLITHDTVSGLDWLDLTETNNLSYNAVVSELGSGGDYEGFRVATSAEVVALWANFGIDLTAGAPTANLSYLDPSIQVAASVLGNILYEQSPNYPHGVLGYIDTSEHVSPLYTYLLGAYQTRTDSLYNPADGLSVSVEASYRAQGTYLVSAVPVPAAVWLFGSGLLGLVGVARRKKA